MSFITEKTTKEQLTKEYVSYPAVKGTLEEKPFYEHRYAPLFFEVPIGSKVLDVGVNDGVFAEMLKNKRKCKVTGIDISEVALEEAKKKGLHVLVADAENLPFQDEYFDVVNCQEVLSHLFDPVQAISEMKRVLKKNGILLGSVPHETLQRFAWEDKRMVRKYYTVDELSVLLRGSFETAHIKTLTGAQFSMSLAQSFLSSEPCEMLFKCGKNGVLGWDSALQDRSVLRAWFGFTQSPGTAYYRMQGFADKMQKWGAETHYNPYNEDVLNSCSEWAEKIKWLPSQGRFANQHIVDQIYALWKAADMTIWQITSSRDVLALLTALRDPLNLHPLHPKKPLWLEMDDWMFDLPATNYASTPYYPNSESESVAYDQLKLVDGVITSTQYIKDKLNQMMPEKPVYIVKNSLDFDIWDHLSIQRPAHEQNPNLIRIAFSGCGNHSADLEIIKRPLLALLEEFPNLEFISLPFKCFDDVTHPRLLKWDMWVGLSKFPQISANWEPDIFIGPLRDNEFNRAKSNLRWLEASALKVPFVGSKIYPFENSIRNGKDGIVVGNNAKAWYDALKDLIVNKEKRGKIGEAAYQEVRHNYDMEKTAQTYLSILKQIKSDFVKGKDRANKS